MRKTLFLSVIALASCNSADDNPQRAFVENLMPLCGGSYSGKVVSTDAVDEDWRQSAITLGPVECGIDAFRMPLKVGEDTSRTWILSPEKTSLTLKHDHRHKDGTPDAVTFYGGTTEDAGTATRQDFPVDNFSIELFEREGLSASVTNTWTFDITPGETLAYELSRPPVDGASQGRFFRVEIDISKPL